jgi:hypothetical protein
MLTGLIVKQVVESIFKGARSKLPGQINWQETGAGIDVFVACHENLLLNPIRLYCH